MLKLFLSLFLLTGSLYSDPIPAEASEFSQQLSSVKYIEKAFDYIIRESYTEALYCFEKAESLTNPLGYFSDSKSRLILIGQLIIYSILQDLDLFEVLSYEKENKNPAVKDPLFRKDKKISRCVAIQLDEEISEILTSMENDYFNQDVFFFDFGIGRIRTWIAKSLKPTIAEFYRK